MMKLEELLRVLDPATSVEIVDAAGRSIYCGILLNLSYCKVEELLNHRVGRIRMKNEEHGYRLVIEVLY